MKNSEGRHHQLDGIHKFEGERREEVGGLQKLLAGGFWIIGLG